MRLIKINIETHNADDWYYTYTYSKIFMCNNRTDEEIKIILNSIVPKEYLDTTNSICGYNEIDIKDLKTKLAEYDIVPVDDMITHYYELREVEED